MSSIPLNQRKLYIPQMSYESSACMAAAFRSIGVDAQPSPNSDEHTLELARQYLSGDECLPEAVTLGNFLKVTQLPDYDPDKTAFMLPTSNGPCRYGHYLPLAKRVFHQIRGENVLFAAPTSSDGYGGIGDEANKLVRTGWRAAVAADVIRKKMLMTRPYETEAGTTDQVYWQSIDKICAVLEKRQVPHRVRMKNIISTMTEIRDDFRAVPVDKSQDKLLIGVVGEIFCRHNNFSNNDMFRLIEKHGGVVWVSDIAEWVMYTNDEEVWRLDRYGKSLSFEMLGSRLKQAVMAHDEHRIVSVFEDDFVGFEEPHHVRETLDLAVPYMPREGSRGEMVMSMGKALWYHKKGAAGVIDISPFTCMNGIITEAVYPRVSREHDNFPIRVFYFDGVQSNADADLEIFMELARNYQKRHSA